MDRKSEEKKEAESLKILVFDPVNLFSCIVHCPGHIFMGESFQDCS